MPQPWAEKGGDCLEGKGEGRVLRLKALLEKRRGQIGEWV